MIIDVKRFMVLH